MSTIRNANVATVAAQYSQEYRTPCRPSIAFLSTRLRMERLSLLRPVAVKRLLRRRGGLRIHQALALSEADLDRGHPAASRSTARDHAIGDIVDARPLDAPAGQIKLGERGEHRPQQVPLGHPCRYGQPHLEQAERPGGDAWLLPGCAEARAARCSRGPPTL